MSSERAAIVADRVTKTYRLGVGRARVREMLPSPVDKGIQRIFPKWWGRDTFNALDDVSLQVPRGCSVGVVGHNGAGKTTLLKIIAAVTSPNSGTVSVSGRAGALIDVLIGFHPDLTGRENVFLLGAIYGLGRRAMLARVSKIFEFAEIDELADTPLKRYSAGMIARLGFSIFTELDLEILLVDEVLAVGDASFQRKCIAWLDGYRARGGTLMFVSHNLGLVRSMTEQVVWLDHGRIAGLGATSDVLASYASAMEKRDGGAPWYATGTVRKQMITRGLYRWGAGGARVEEVHVSDPVAIGAPLEVQISYEASELQTAVFCLGFVDEGGRELGAAASPALMLEHRRGTIVCSIDPLPLRSGIYFPVVAILSSDGLVRDRWRLERAIVLNGDGELVGSDFGPVKIAATWSPDSTA
jgi:homopolymeric O-antigen transport system ATP-binding protein